MHLLTAINCAQVTLSWNRLLTGNSDKRIQQLRGALANAFQGNDVFHQHNLATGKEVYRYPKVQYRWYHGKGVIIAWGEVAPIVLNLRWLDLKLRLGTEEVQVNTAELKLHHGQFGVSDYLIYYSIQSPLLLFSQDNYKRYIVMNEQERLLERNRLLVSNMLVALRELGVNVPERLYAGFVEMHTEDCWYKVKLLGMRGVLVTNMVVPDGFACGRGVSHGFGELQVI